MIQFQLFGIPVRIEPWFWLTAFFLGGGTRLGKGSFRDDLLWVLVWMVVACFSVLVHEFGHALTARKLSGGKNYIKLWAMGGLAYHEGGRPTRKARLWTIFMGPGAGFILFGVTCLVIIGLYGPQAGSGVIKALITYQKELPPEVYEVYKTQYSSWRLFQMFIWINFWWSLVNLLPVFPLDGGQFYSEWTGKTLQAYKLGAAVGALFALIAILFLKDWYIALLFGFLAFNNFKNLQNFQGGGGGWR